MQQTIVEEEVYIELFEILSSSISSPDDYYQKFLLGALRLIPEAKQGLVIVERHESWRFIAAVGHTIDDLVDVEFPPLWNVRHNELLEISGEENLLDSAPSAGPAKDIQKKLLPASISLRGRYGFGPESSVIVNIDIPKASREVFSGRSRDSFAKLLRVVGSFHRMISDKSELHAKNQELARQNRALESQRAEINRLNDKLRELLDMTNKLGDGTMPLDAYLRQILVSALSVVEDADFGSIALFEGESWRFVGALGHDEELLSRLPLRAEWAYQGKTLDVVENILGLMETKIPHEIFTQFETATRPTARSLIVNLEVSESLRVNLSLDIAAGKDTRFSQQSRKTIEAFAQLATSFVKHRVHARMVTQAYRDFVQKLALIAEAHDQATAEHNRRVSSVSAWLAKRLGCEDRLVDEIREFAGLHDIGKLFLDRSLLNKNDSLSPEEFEQIRRHTLFSEELLDDPYFRTARNIALYHHERFDGSGYPFGLAGKAIPLEAQIVAVADVYDALRSARPYKARMSPETVLAVFRYGDDRIQPGMFNPELLKIIFDDNDELERNFYASNLNFQNVD